MPTDASVSVEIADITAKVLWLLDTAMTGSEYGMTQLGLERELGWTYERVNALLDNHPGTRVYVIEATPTPAAPEPTHGD